MSVDLIKQERVIGVRYGPEGDIAMQSITGGAVIARLATTSAAATSYRAIHRTGIALNAAMQPPLRDVVRRSVGWLTRRWQRCGPARTANVSRCKREGTLRRLPANFKCADIICDFCGYRASSLIGAVRVLSGQIVAASIG